MLLDGGGFGLGVFSDDGLGVTMEKEDVDDASDMACPC